MSGPQIPHVELPEIPIPYWGVVGVAALFIVYAVVAQVRQKKFDLMVSLVGVAGAVAIYMLQTQFKATYWESGDPPTIKPFGTLVALGVYIGSVVAVRHGKDRGLDLDKMNTFIFWVVGLGFVGGHMLDAIFYTPEKINKEGLIYILELWKGLSSFGGFTGAVIGAVLYKLIKKDDVLAYVDTVCSAFPLAWVFGRSGCASVHDHPGKITDAWFAVKCVNHLPHGEGAAFLCSNTGGLGRYDLGLIECVLTIPLALSFWWLWRSRPRHVGFFAGWMCILYAPVRFVLDFYRADQSDKVLEVDPRHFGLTPAQWACFGLVALGFAVIRIGKSSYPPPPASYAEAQAIAERERAEREGDLTEDELDDDEEERRPMRPAPKVSSKVRSGDIADPFAGKKKKKKAKKNRVAADGSKPSDDSSADRDATPKAEADKPAAGSAADPDPEA